MGIDADSQIAIRARSLRKTYYSGSAEVLVFQGLDLYVRRGERVAIIGESGAGKSTLLHLLGGLDKPDSGSICIEGQAVTELSAAGSAEFRNRQLGFVWQNPSLLPEFTALENVMMPLLIRGVHPNSAREAARVSLHDVSLENRQNHRAGELSGGEQQRIAIARAIVAKPSVLLADEPTGSLDFRTGDTIAKLLYDLHKSRGLTSVFVTHNLSFARSCDRVLKLEKGALHPSSPAEWELSGMRGSAVCFPQGDATRLDGGHHV